MEIHLINDLLNQMKGSTKIPEMNTNNYKKILLITTALRNLHKSDHCKTCFKKNKCECRMKLPMKKSLNDNVYFDPKSKDWFDWKGNKHKRELFVLELKREIIDCFVNMHNEVASAVMGCNTNVVPGVDGGSIIYCTLYVSKNEQKEPRIIMQEQQKRFFKNLFTSEIKKTLKWKMNNKTNQQMKIVTTRQQLVVETLIVIHLKTRKNKVLKPW